MASEQLLYRPCVGIMVLNRQGRVWIGRRHDAPGEPEGPGAWWQMPQGGIDEDEDPAKAALRELAEETSIRSVEIIAESRWLVQLRSSHRLAAEGLGWALSRAEAEVVRHALHGSRRRGGSGPARTQGGVRRLALGGHRRTCRLDHPVQAGGLRPRGARICSAWPSRKAEGTHVPVRAVVTIHPFTVSSGWA